MWGGMMHPHSIYIRRQKNYLNTAYHLDHLACLT